MEASRQPKYYNVSVLPHYLENQNTQELTHGYDAITVQIPGVRHSNALSHSIISNNKVALIILRTQVTLLSKKFLCIVLILISESKLSLIAGSPMIQHFHQ